MALISTSVTLSPPEYGTATNSWHQCENKVGEKWSD